MSIAVPLYERWIASFLAASEGAFSHVHLIPCIFICMCVYILFAIERNFLPWRP